MERAIYPSDLTDAEWPVIEPLLPMPAPRGRPRKYGLRESVDAIFYVIRTGCRWRALPHDLPKWQTVYHSLWRGRQTGLGEDLNAELREQ
jgi:transposase